MGEPDTTGNRQPPTSCVLGMSVNRKFDEIKSKKREKKGSAWTDQAVQSRGYFQRDLEIIRFERKKKNKKKAAPQHNKTARLPPAPELLILQLFRWSRKEGENSGQQASV